MKKILFLIFSTAGIMSIPAPLFAARFYFEAPASLRLGEQVEATLFLDTEGETINAIEGKIQFSEDKLSFSGINDGGSIINFWVEDPIINRNEVRFSGIIPGGYTGEKGKILSISIEGKKSGKAEIKPIVQNALLNDGNGTPTHVKEEPALFEVSNLIFEETQLNFFDDHTPPEPIVIEILQDKNMYEGKWTIVFYSQDKNSGIDHYEVKEGINGEWRRAESPYLLSNQEVNEDIFVKAIDRAGNFVESKTEGPRKKQKLVNFDVMFAISVFLVLIIVMAFIIKKRK